MRRWRHFNGPQRLTIDYVPRQRHWGVAISALVIAIFGWAMMGVAYWWQHNEMQTISRALQRAAPEIPVRPPRQRPDRPLQPVTTAEKQELMQVAEQTRLPWGRLFSGLESAAGRNVALLEIFPDAETRSLRVVGEVENIAAVWDYMLRLTEQPAFSGVILKEHELRIDQPQQPTRFTLALKW